jgi:hypothetical protein
MSHSAFGFCEKRALAKLVAPAKPSREQSRRIPQSSEKEDDDPARQHREHVHVGIVHGPFLPKK